MHLTQAPPTCAAVTRRAVATAPVQLPQPGERGHLQHTLVSAIRARHYSRRTEQAYWHWTRQFVLWSGKRHPLELGAPEIGAFLSHLASAREVSASTQRQALAALLFLYQHALGVELPYIDGIVRAKQSQRLPVVLTRSEVASLWEQIPAASRQGLVLRLLYGTGMRLMEGLRLRVQDIDFGAGCITVRNGKGAKDRTVMLPQALRPQLRALLDERAAWHQADLIAGRADVELPHALHLKYPRAGQDLRWQWVFATAHYPTCPRTGAIRRHHLHEDGIQRLMARAVRCAACGAAVVGINAERYGCSARKDRGPTVCASGHTVKRAVLEQRLLTELRSELLAPAAERKLRREVQAVLAQLQRDTVASSSNVGRRAAELDAEIERLVEAIALTGISPALRQRLASAEAARASLQTEAMVAAPALRVDEVMATWRPKLLALKAALAGEEDRDRTRAILAEVLGTVKVGRDEQGRSYADMNEPAERLVLSAAGGSSLQVVAGACNLLERRLYMAG